MADSTEMFRRAKIAEINCTVESNDPDEERSRLENIHGKVWSTIEVSKDFEIVGFMAPYVVAIDRKTNVKGSLEFQHSPRFYFNFRPHKG